MDKEDRREIERLKKAKLKAEKKDEFKEVAKFCNNLGELYAKHGMFEEAIEEHEKELGLSDALGVMIDAAVACRKIGECYSSLQQFDKALSLQQRHLDIAKSCSNLVEQQRALATIGRTYFLQLDTVYNKTTKLGVGQKAEDAYLRSLELCEALKETVLENEYLVMRARLFLNLSLLNDSKEDLTECLTYMKKAMGIAQKYNLSEDLYRCQYNLAGIYQKKCKYTEAMRYFEEASRSARKLKDKPSEADAFFQKATVCAQLEDFVTARRLLKKSRKLGYTTDDDKKKLMDTYRAVVKMDEACTRLKELPEVDVARIPLCETIADQAAEIGNYKQAIQYYRKTIMLSENNQCSSGSLAALYVSLAQTFKDDKQYDKAIEQYKKEIESRSESEIDQVCRTWLNIAEIQELNGQDYDTITGSYLNAFNAAKQGKHRRLQIQCLQSLLEVQKVYKKDYHRIQTEDKLVRLRERFDIAPGEENSQDTGDEDGPGEEDDDEEIAMSSLSESDEEFSTAGRVTGRRKKKWPVNEKGESPLHRACIANDLNKVVKLIEQGHPVNVRDTCGWTPLHEAANHRNDDVAKYLLEHGASANDRGGVGCSGVTPLIDAAMNGNIQVMQILIDHGANVLAKDNDHLTALDHLVMYKQSLEDDCESISDSQLTMYENMVTLLRERNPNHKAPSRGRTKRTHSQKKGPEQAMVTASQELPTISRPSRPDHTMRRSRNDIITDSIAASDSDDDHLLRKSSKRKCTPLPENSVESDDSDDIYHNPLRDEIQPSQQSGADAYKTAISSIGSVACRAKQAEPSRSQMHIDPTSGPALISEDDYIDDDWLIDDMKPVKRRKMDVNGLFSTGTVKSKKTPNRTDTHGTDMKRNGGSSCKRNRRRISDDEIESNSDSEASPPVVINTSHNESQSDVQDYVALPDITLNTSVHTSSNASEDALTDLDRIMFEDVDTESDHNFNTGVSSVVSVRNGPRKQLKMTDFGCRTSRTNRSAVSDVATPVANPSSHIQSSGHRPGSVISQARTHPLPGTITQQDRPLAGVLRVKVQIKDKTLLIPIQDGDGTKSFNWLAGEAAQRYYRMVGMRPALTLGTSDGAFFSPEDLVSLLLCDNDKIEGYIDSWELPPMAERYTAACKSLNTVVYRNIKMSLQACETSGKLMLSDLALRSARFQPIVLSIQCQTCLRELNIQGNRIGDTGLSNLCKVLDTLPNLVSLNLSANDLSGEGLKHMCGVLTPDGSKCLQNLSSLDISHNSLYDGCTAQIAALVRGVPRLERLALASCGLTMKFFQADRIPLTEAIQASALQHLDMSMNSLGCVGVELLLMCQAPGTLTSLDLSSTVPAPGPSTQLYRHLYNYLSQSGCVLQELSVRDCCLGPEDSDFLLRLPVIGKHLRKLDLSINPKLSNNVIQQLLQSTIDASCILEEILCTDCGIQAPLDVDFLDALSEALSSAVPLRVFSFSCHKIEKIDVDSVTQVWKEKWGELASIECSEQLVRLGVSGR